MSKPRPVNVELVHPADPLYSRVTRIMEAHHRPLVEAGVNIALVHRRGIKTDKDGHLTLGYAKKASDMDKEFHEHDAVIVINIEAWETLSEEQREALLDHELMHVAVVYDTETGDVKRDDRDRPVLRIRKHDLSEFRDIVQRHGAYLADIEEFVKAALASKKVGADGGPTLFTDDADAGSDREAV